MISIDPRTIPDNAFKLIADDWMLITGGTKDSFNTMTASWGALGELWHKKVCFCFVRPTRHTFSFMEKSETYTLSFFTEEHRAMLSFCGKVSGRDIDKVKQTGLTPVVTETGAVYFAQARLVLECRKIYCDDIDPKLFLAPEIHDAYPKKDYHRMYIGEILNCWTRSA
jgi:flavin reductase (DIM6/NTAB) family NADH-FMN oxidoreductase RutF